MKKMMVVAMCAALALMFTACGSSSTDATAEAEDVAAEVEAEEAADDVDEDLNMLEEVDDTEVGYQTATYKGLTYSYPADSDWTESDDIVNIILGDNEAIVLIMSLDLSDSGDEYDDETSDALLETAVLSALYAYDDVQNESMEDLTMAGCPAKEVMAAIYTSSTWMNYNCIAFYDENGQYIYMVQYAASAEAEGRLSEYQAILDSITLGEGSGAEDGATANAFSEDQVEITAVPTEDGHVAMFITNNSDSIIQELDVQINYKDENGTTIDMDTDGHDVVLPGSTVVSRMDAPDSYADYEIEKDIDLDAHPNYVNHAADVEINSNLGEDCIIIEITNNSDIEIREIEYDVVLYKDGNIVTITYPQDVYDVEPGTTVTEKESTYGKDFDDYEIYLNQAHTFK